MLRRALLNPLALVLWTTAASAGVLWATAASAGEPSPKDVREARELFAKAEQDEASGHFDDALAKLEQAIRIKATPGLRFHVGYAKEKLGRYREALADYEEAERLAHTEKKDEVLAALKDVLPSLRERIPVVEISVADPVFTVSVDQGDAAPYREPLRLDPGPHRLVIRAGGRRDYQKDILLRERDRLHMDAVLEPLPLAKTFANEPPPLAPPPSSKTTAIGMAVGAGILVAGGVPFLLLAGGAQDQGLRCQEAGKDCGTYRDRVRVYDWTAATLFAAGLTAGVVSVVLFASPPSEPSNKKSSPPARTELGLGGSGVVIRGSFE